MLKLLALLCGMLWVPYLCVAQFTVYPDNMFADTAYAPFYYGVASGDPTDDKVLIWTAVFTPQGFKAPVPLRWEISDDSTFTTTINKGETLCKQERDYTTMIDAGGLQAGHAYFYRFIAPDGKVSQTGKAQTLPPDSVQHLKLALASCSGVWSGYFNAYRRMAERKDIDFIIHVGDYIYDDVDPDEHIRMPYPEPTSPSNLAEWRNRHKYYLLDPDLRFARQNKTWIAEWDNHDTHYREREKTMDGITAFYEYVPIRMPDSSNPVRIYRSFRFGNLADLHMIDMQMYKGIDSFGAGQQSILGNGQDQWFKNSLKNSTATWHLVGNQEMMGSWLSKGIPKALNPPPGNGIYFDPITWDGYNEDRNRLYHFIDSNHINNMVVLSGDLHMSFIIDLTSEPLNREVYHRHTGKGAIGVEVLGPSITAGNIDEEHIPAEAIPLFQSISRALNPHHRWVQFTKHGYTTIDVTPELCTTQFCYSVITHKSNRETRSKKFVVKNGVNHWQH